MDSNHRKHYTSRFTVCPIWPLWYTPLLFLDPFQYPIWLLCRWIGVQNYILFLFCQIVRHFFLIFFSNIFFTSFSYSLKCWLSTFCILKPPSFKFSISKPIFYFYVFFYKNFSNSEKKGLFPFFLVYCFVFIPKHAYKIILK